MKYFECKPGELCEKADCCCSRETKPTLSVGDYLRLSEATGEPMDEIWKSKGMVTASPMPGGLFMLNLSLEHDPCPYLSEMKCSVYEARPIVCATFPMMMLANHPEQASGENFGGYKCLQNVLPRPEELAQYETIDQILTEEAGIEMHLGSGRILDMRSTDQFYEFCITTRNIQREKDPLAKSRISKKLFEYQDKIHQIILTQSVHVIEYSQVLGALATCLLDKKITKMLKNLDQASLKRLQENSRKWKEVLKKIDS